MSQTNNKSLIFSYLFLILLSLLAAYIYLIYRDSSILFNQLFLHVRFDLDFERQQIQDLLPLPNWFIYSLPGGIWVYVTTIIASKHECMENKFTKILAFLPSTYAIGLEFFQLFHFTDGTFDWVDLLVIIAATYTAKRVNRNELTLTSYPNFLNLALVSAFLVLFLSDVHR
jgi:hypothetical protein